MLDLKKTNYAETAEIGFEFELLLPGDNTPSGAKITVRGDQSKTVKAYARKKYAEFKAREQAMRRRGKGDEEMTLEEAEDLAIEAAVVRVIGWKGISEGGVPVEFTKENASRVFRDHPWIREQIMEVAQDILNFRPE